MQDCRERAVTRLSNGKVNVEREQDARTRVLGRAMPDQSGPWVPRFVDALKEFRALGLEFDFAWRVAVRQHPPRTAEIGTRNDPGALDWFYEKCMAAWFDLPAADGSPSKLRGLAVALLPTRGRRAAAGGYAPPILSALAISQPMPNSTPLTIARSTSTSNSQRIRSLTR